MVKFSSKRVFKVIIICLISLAIIFWNPNNIFVNVKGLFIGITLPVQRVFSGSADKISALGKIFSSIGRIKKENEFLIEENIELQSKNVQLADISKENDILREQLGVLPREKFDLESAHIIGRDTYHNNYWIMIDKGEKQGIKNGMSVIVSNSVLVGRVEEVYNSTAKVVFITNPNININAETVETGAIGGVKGDYGLGLVMDLVLQTDNLKTGDDVITSDISQNIPRGLLIGKIKEVNSANNDLFQKAIVVSPVDFSKLRLVFVIKNSRN